MRILQAEVAILNLGLLMILINGNMFST